ncbi:MAG: UDP-N-acetylmuramoyl-L-alanyl-D-glutamate--2,6-diaminopimelate ligase [Candidatus Fermentibacteraceae bacterium]
MKLSTLLHGLGIDAGATDPEVTLVTADSRCVVHGALFVAVTGFRTDGHLHISEALSAGAAAVITETQVDNSSRGVLLNPAGNNRTLLSLLAARFYREPWAFLTTAGITGTNGKTSTAHMLAWILRSAGLPTGVLGTVGHTVAGSFVPADVTTPDALETARLMRTMVDQGDRACVMEVSSHALSLARVDHVRFDTAVFTNISQDHLDFHVTMDQYLKAKLHLLDLLKPGGTPVLGSTSREWAGIPGALSFGSLPTDDFMVSHASTGIDGSRFTLGTPEGMFQVALRAPGTFSIMNAAGSIAAASVLGIPVEKSVASLATFSGVPGRMERVEGADGFLVAVDYAHTPDALERVLTQGRDLAQGRLISVFGCGGDRDPGKRPLMGAISRKLAAVTVVTSDNPRTEDPMEIIRGILSGTGDMENVIVEPDRRKAIKLAVSIASPGDVVIIAGKGHEDYQILGTRKIHFDDREEAMNALRELS